MIYLGEKEEKSKDTSSQVMEKLLKTRTIFISGEINQELAEKVSTQLLILQEMGDEPIKVFINSQGGHVEAGDTIHDMIKFVKPKVIVIGTGWVATDSGVTFKVEFKGPAGTVGVSSISFFDYLSKSSIVISGFAST